MCYKWGSVADDCQRPPSNRCCGTNRGDYDGVTGCNFLQEPKCLDNNNYPCIYNNTFVGAANTVLPEHADFTGPTQHKSSC